MKCIFLKCFYPKCIFAKCTRLACLLSFGSLFYLRHFWIKDIFLIWVAFFNLRHFLNLKHFLNLRLWDFDRLCWFFINSLMTYDFYWISSDFYWLSSDLHWLSTEFYWFSTDINWFSTDINWFSTDLYWLSTGLLQICYVSGLYRTAGNIQSYISDWIGWDFEAEEGIIITKKNHTSYRAPLNGANNNINDAHQNSQLPPASN